MNLNMQLTANLSLVSEQCCACGVVFAMPKTLYNSLRNDPAQSFYCPNGHQQHYKVSQDKQLLKEAEEKISAEQAHNKLLQAELTKLKKRRKL